MDSYVSVVSWLLAIVPVVLLLAGILVLKWEAAKVGAVAWIAAAIIAMLFFGCDFKLVALASSKGMSLSLYVLLIIWGAVLLYNIADKAGAIQVIGSTLQRLSDDELLRCLLFAWCFTSLLQGLAGFGVPVAVVAPLMVVMGYKPITAVAACLVGHSWSISFGSMGSSYNAIQLVTGIPGEEIGPVMALLFSVAIYLTGFATAHIFGGMAAVKKGAVPILLAGTAMSAGLLVMNLIGAAQLASLVAAIAGCAVLIVYNKIRTGGRAPAKRDGEAEKPAMPFLTACAPYCILIALSIIAQIPFIKQALKQFYLGLDYPAMETALGYQVQAEAGYSKIQLFSHPAPILFVSAIAGCFIYVLAAKVPRDKLWQAAKATVKKCIPTSVGISLMVMMALVMIDSGMTYTIALGIAATLGSFYALLAPFIGTLGTFITGSNTNSNIMFGALQYETAVILGKSTVLFAAAQSLGGSLGVSMSPSTIMMGASNVGLSGKESDIMHITAKYCLGITAVVGVIVWLIS